METSLGIGGTLRGRAPPGRARAFIAEPSFDGQRARWTASRRAMKYPRTVYDPHSVSMRAGRGEEAPFSVGGGSVLACLLLSVDSSDRVVDFLFAHHPAGNS